MRRFQNELSSFGAQNNGIHEPRGRHPNNRSTARSVKTSEQIDKRVSQVRRMQQIYRQGKAIAEQEKQSRGLAGNRNRYQPTSSTSHYRDTNLSQESDDDLISWAGALDVSDLDV